MRGQSPASSGASDTRLASRLRDLSDRVRRLESRPTPVRVRVGGWLLEEASNGDLVARYDDGTERVVASRTE